MTARFPQARFKTFTVNPGGLQYIWQKLLIAGINGKDTDAGGLAYSIVQLFWKVYLFLQDRFMVSLWSGDKWL